MLSELELLGDGAAGARCLLPQLSSVNFSIHSGLSYETYAKFPSSRRLAFVCDSDRVRLATLGVAVSSTSEDTSASGRPTDRLPWETYYVFVALRNNGLNLLVINGAVSMSSEE
ncbi:hypothetical protein FIBSPDRAFT_3 [Athelia psychrophila]|uniref:Uncharacterized protein n=1 Tax=Athelia psychrophila TaxID=1759441 RepID=A0A166WUL7_9AGAM|nr:hypothetical protein FIBSPDRAFT_588299 [Fibularhizoctonia sp. CBS 109695]KZP34126.1 hypothetical protein FIBSPDRAFT_3 [Fibularhizoctonia sp. CBS 109695]